MASFPFDGAAQLADIIIPMTEEMAREVLEAAFSRENGFSSAAIYYTDKANKRQSVLVTVTVHETYMYGYCGEYHPRKEGVAEFIYK